MNSLVASSVMFLVVIGGGLQCVQDPNNNVLITSQYKNLSEDYLKRVK